MDIHAKEHPQAIVVSIIGDIDFLNSNQITDFFRTQVPGDQNRFVIDLSQVGFMGSAGVRAILDALRKSRKAGGDLCLAAGQPDVARILEISGLTAILGMHPTIDEALASFQV